MAIECLVLGAGQEIGRSCVVVIINGKRIMFDCGLHMGWQDRRRYPDFSLISKSRDFDNNLHCIVITHFHLDHVGALPYFTEVCGFGGRIYMTKSGWKEAFLKGLLTTLQLFLLIGICFSLASVVKFVGCSSLETLAELPCNLKKLLISNSTIRELPSIQHLHRLETLSVNNSQMLERCTSLGALSGLSTLPILKSRRALSFNFINCFELDWNALKRCKTLCTGSFM